MTLALWAVVASGAAAFLGARSSAVRRSLAERVAHPFRRAWRQLRQSLASQARVVSLLTAQLAVTAGLAVTLWCCLQAFGIELSWTAVLIALLAGSTIGSAAPVPGGIGTVEAATAAALLAAGVPAAEAVSVALLYRLVTFWARLPIGWFCLLWLHRQGAL